MGALCSICIDSTMVAVHSNIQKDEFCHIFSRSSFEQLPFVSCAFVGALLLAWFPFHLIEYDLSFCQPPNNYSKFMSLGIKE